MRSHLPVSFFNLSGVDGTIALVELQTWSIFFSSCLFTPNGQVQLTSDGLKFVVTPSMYQSTYERASEHCRNVLLVFLLS